MVLRRLLPLFATWGLTCTWSVPGHTAEPSLAPAPSWLFVSRSEGAESCPDHAQLQTLAEGLLGNSSPDVRVEVAFTHQSGTFVAEITRPQRSGIRRLSDSHTDCSALASAVATVLALLIDDELRAAPPAAVPLTSVPPQSLPSAAEAQVSAPPRISEQSAGISVAGGASLGYFDEVTPLVEASLFYQFKRLRVALGVLQLFSKKTALEPGTLAHHVTAGSLAVCFRVLGGEKFALSPCAGASVGALMVEAEGFTDNSQETRPWLAFPLGLTASGRVGEARGFAWGWRVGASALVASRQEEFVIEGLGVGFETGRISAVFTGGLEGSFGF